MTAPSVVVLSREGSRCALVILLQGKDAQKLRPQSAKYRGRTPAEAPPKMATNGEIWCVRLGEEALRSIGLSSSCFRRRNLWSFAQGRQQRSSGCAGGEAGAVARGLRERHRDSQGDVGRGERRGACQSAGFATGVQPERVKVPASVVAFSSKNGILT
eukprot:scaffold2175_cov241-Pinguiococcus_pyrenoidosus.AAC.3